MLEEVLLDELLLVPDDTGALLDVGVVVELVPFDVASSKPLIPAVAMTATDPIDTIIFVAVFMESP